MTSVHVKAARTLMYVRPKQCICCRLFQNYTLVLAEHNKTNINATNGSNIVG